MISLCYYLPWVKVQKEERYKMSCYANSFDPLKSKQYKYIIPGNPIPLARPRFGKGTVFDSQSTIKQHCAEHVRDQHGKLPFLVGPIHADIIFFMEISATASKKRRDKLRGSHHIYKPDFSNMLKFIEDVCQGIVYGDDCIIASICGSKIYDDEPRTQIIFSEIIYDE